MNIDQELLQAIAASDFNQIDYDYLLAHNPAKIGIEEARITAENTTTSTAVDITITNLSIDSENGNHQIPLRIYSPKEINPKPVMLYFHGGAFIFGSPEQYDDYCIDLVQRLSINIVSVDYRLAPEHPYPAAIFDGYDALVWIVAKGSTYGMDTANITIAGSSAGGALAASITHYARDKNNHSIQQQYLLYPPLDDSLNSDSMQRLANAPMQSKASAELMWKTYLADLPKDTPNYGVPLKQNCFRNLPSAVIVACEFDPFLDEAKAYADKLIKAGVPTRFIQVNQAVHAFDFFNTELTRNYLEQQKQILHQLIYSV